MRYLLQGKKAILGFRGRAVIHISLLWMVIGLQLLITPLKGSAQALEHHNEVAFLFALLPTWAQVSVWVVSALVALSSCRTDPTRPHDRLAFMALIIPPAVLVGSYIWAVVYNLLTYHLFVSVYAEAIPIWGIFLSLVLCFSRWPEPVPGASAHERN